MSKLLLSEKPLSLRTLCCISVVLHDKEKTLLPREIKETVKELENLKRPNLLGYIDSKQFSSTRLMAEFFALTGKNMEYSKEPLSWKNIKDMRQHVKIYRRFLTSFVPTRVDRKDWGIFRKKYLYELLMGNFGIEFSKKEVNSMILWTGPELPGVFFSAV
ncbi:hypothetical protein LAU_0105 [Lausannevirus]|uniref:Uncharacterized protein n=1 Tax=Lausannevirus TaxID=999883 RepID=F2WL34_9VIRU|nr:hypothetical protein LAU_0105 [Lausannevirus]AEA06957.1 hypothetical protein LAU_0105 [Lausannevirus]